MPSIQEINQAAAVLAKKHLLPFAIVMMPEFKLGKHIKMLASKLEAVERGEIKRLIITMPPRHCKSLLCSQYFPAWYLGRNPTHQVIAASYGDDLARDFGRKVRNTLAEPEYKHIFSTELSDDSSSQGKFNTKEGGVYVATGIGGAITGRGGHLCFPAGTKITTSRGEINIEDCKNGDRVLSYNHDNNTLEFRRLKATSQQISRGFTTLTTATGNCVRATNNHPIFAIGRGYVEIDRLTKGEKVQVFQNTKVCCFNLCSLWYTISTCLGGLYKESEKRWERFLLWSSVFGKTSCNKKQQKMLLWKDCKKRASVLFKKMYSIKEKVKRHLLFDLFKNNQTNKSFDKVLLHELQEQLSFLFNEKAKSKLQAWFGFSKVSKRVQKNKVRTKEGFKSVLYNLWSKIKISFTSSRLQSEEQSERKFSYGMFHSSCHPSSLSEIAISDITSDNKVEEVYNLEVDGNNNYYANNILVHNCIIDDAIKGRQDADSEQIRKKVWEWYTSVLRTRLMPNGAIIVVGTRWHKDDLIGKLLKENTEGWEVLHLPAINESNEPLWPEMFSLEELEKTKKAIGAREWACLYQGTPSDPENQIFHPEMFRYYDELPTEGEVTICMTVDPAFTQNKTSDDSCIMITGKWKDKTYVLEYYNARVLPNELITEILRLYRKWKPHFVGIESFAAQKVIGFYLQEKAAQEGINFTWQEIKQTGDKLTKVKRLEPYFREGKILMKRHHTTLEKQLIEFPQGDHDDIVDALQMSFEFRIFDISTQARDDEYFNNLGLTYNAYGEPEY